MAFFDLPLDELRTYSPKRHEPADFDAFWQQTLAEARQHPLDPVFELHDSGLRLIDIYDVTFSGYGGHRIKGWYLRPHGVETPLPCIVEYIGYSGGRGLPNARLHWAAAGYAHFVMDNRGQGSGWRRGYTPDYPEVIEAATPGFLTQGILDPHQHYYRRLFTDAVRAIETVQSRADVDSTRLAVAGVSQGGGLAIAAAGLAGDQVALCLPQVPFLCHFRGAVGKTDTLPYYEVVRYLQSYNERAEVVFNTLDYFDGLNFAPRIQAHSFFSVGLMDDICPPSTVFAVFNHITAPKEISVYPYNTHQGSEEQQWFKELQLANQLPNFRSPLQPS